MAGKSYREGCHRKANRFKAQFPTLLEEPDTTIITCNCSICVVNGYLIFFLTQDQIEWERGGLEYMKSYRFGRRLLTQYFCPECGTSVLAIMDDSGIAVNVRSIDNIDIEELKLETYDGKSL